MKSDRKIKGAQHHENSNDTNRSSSTLRQRRPSSTQIQARDKEIKIEQVLSVTEEKLTGNKMLCFRCQSEIKGEMKPFEIKFELSTCKWFLWKM